MSARTSIGRHRRGTASAMDMFWNRIIEMHQDVRRAYPRIHIATSVAFDVRGEIVHVEAHDIGRGGMQVRCDRETATRIAPMPSTSRGRLKARILLRIGNTEHPIMASCAVAYVTQVEGASEDEQPVALGFHFCDMSAKDRQTLERFIACSLEPAAR